MKTEHELLEQLRTLNIPYTLYEHPAVFTVEQAQELAGHVPGIWVKNLFLKDSKKHLWLITAVHDTKIELKKVAKALAAPELRFADATLLLEHIGVTPGSVTPLGIINDPDHVVTVVLDAQLFNHPIISVHPLRNTASITMTPQDTQKFLESLGAHVIVLDFTTLSSINI